MDEETWLIDTQGTVYSFRGSELERAFENQTLNEAQVYLVMQDFKPHGAMCKEGERVHYTTWEGVARDHSNMTCESLRAKILNMTESGFKQSFQAPNGSVIDTNEVDAILSINLKSKAEKPIRDRSTQKQIA